MDNTVKIERVRKVGELPYFVVSKGGQAMKVFTYMDSITQDNMYSEDVNLQQAIQYAKELRVSEESETREIIEF